MKAMKSPVKLIALNFVLFVLIGCKPDERSIQNAKAAEAQFEGVQPGMLGVEAMQALGDDAVDTAQMQSQVSIPTLQGTVTWTTLSYRLKDGSTMYVTYDGTNVVNKQRML
jgi:hypothetical protein